MTRFELDPDRLSVRKKHVFSPARLARRMLIGCGVVLLGIYVGAHLHRYVMFHAEMKSFENARNEAAKENSTGNAAIRRIGGEDAGPAARDREAVTPRNNARSTAGALRRTSGIPLAILRIPSIHLEVPVLKGTDDITLNRGVGQIAGTAAPGEPGNIGIAGHRDSFFRDLKDIGRGDIVELETTSASETYIVDRILITGPDDVSVLQPSDTQSLTLVTCYPFHFIGPAPRRFIVHASVQPAKPRVQ